MDGKDVAALLLRGSLGPMLFAHGRNKVAGGLDGTTGWFEALGLRPARAHAVMAAATEMGAGAAITAGVAGPLPAAAAVGLMAVAARTDHRGKGFFVFKGGWEYTGVVAGASVALAALGNGRVSLDRMLGRQPRGGVRGAATAAGLGCVAAAALLAACYRPNSAEPEGAKQSEDDAFSNTPAAS